MGDAFYAADTDPKRGYKPDPEFDPKTAKFQSWAIPGGGNIVRNTSVTREGDFVLANSLVNRVTLVKITR